MVWCMKACPPGRELRILECNSAYDSKYLCDNMVFSLCLSCLTSTRIEIIQEFKNSFSSKILLFGSTRYVKSIEKTHRIEEKLMPKRSEPLQKIAWGLNYIFNIIELLGYNESSFAPPPFPP